MCKITRQLGYPGPRCRTHPLCRPRQADRWACADPMWRLQILRIPPAVMVTLYYSPDPEELQNRVRLVSRRRRTLTRRPTRP